MFRQGVKRGIMLYSAPQYGRVTMQLDRTNVKQLEKNGMVVAMVAVYDYELDRSGYEVTKSLTGKLLSRATWDSRAEADSHYKEIALELGATPQEIYHSEIN